MDVKSFITLAPGRSQNRQRQKNGEKEVSFDCFLSGKQPY